MMDTKAKAQRFRDLHLGPEILVVVNAWDAASARVYEDVGVKAIGTTSAGIANSHGYPDDEFVPRDVIMQASAEIVRAVELPVTVDILNGFGRTIPDIVNTVREVIDMGGVGVNIEDATEEGGARLFDIEEQAEKIAAVCKAVDESGIPIVVNARTDSFWLKIGDEKQRLAESIRRANRYREAGAQCLFVPAAADRETIRTLVKEIDGPLNILTVAGCPTIRELQDLGVRRVSEGSGPMRAAMMLARNIAKDLMTTGTYARFHGEAAVPYAEANKLFS
jgi:2-methylisocitrate lyase-like PEP mutase family enzyme